MQNGFMHGQGFMEGMAAVGPLMMIFWLVVLVALIVVIVRWLGGSVTDSRQPGAIEILENRFARGEIDAAEFDDRKQQLKG